MDIAAGRGWLDRAGEEPQELADLRQSATFYSSVRALSTHRWGQGGAGHLSLPPGASGAPPSALAPPSASAQALCPRQKCMQDVKRHPGTPSPRDASDTRSPEISGPLRDHLTVGRKASWSRPGMGIPGFLRPAGKLSSTKGSGGQTSAPVEKVETPHPLAREAQGIIGYFLSAQLLLERFDLSSCVT